MHVQYGQADDCGIRCANRKTTKTGPSQAYLEIAFFNGLRDAAVFIVTEGPSPVEGFMAIICGKVNLLLQLHAGLG